MSDFHAILLGTGTPAPNPNRRGPATLIAFDKGAYQIDCGSGTVHQIVRAGRSPVHIHHMFLTHLHSDHYIDLDHFIITRWILGCRVPLTVYGPVGIREMMDHWMALHAYDIDIRIKTRKRNKERPEIIVREISAGQLFDDDGLKVSAFEVSHWPLAAPYGFRFDAGQRGIVVSGDTCPCENLIRHSRGADLLIHECVDYSNIQVREGDGWANIEERIAHLGKTHTLPTELGVIARDAGVPSVATTHMIERSDPAKIRREIGETFAGRITIGEDLKTLASP